MRGNIEKRRTNGGSIRYRIRWDAPRADGSRRQRSQTFATRKEAEKQLARRLREAELGDVPPSDDTVAAYLDRWLDAAGPSWSTATAYSYASSVRCRIGPRLGAVPLARLTALQIQSAWTAMLTEGYAANTVRATHALLDAALAQAVRWRLLPYNPAEGVELPADRRPAPEAWTASEAARFLAENRADEKYRALWRLALDSGMRIGELLALRWDDADLDNGTISVRRTLTRDRDGRMRIGEATKTHLGRAIPITPETTAALRRHRADQLERRLLLGPGWTDLDLVFDRGDGTAHNRDTVRCAFGRAVKRAGVRPITVHGTRHTMATLLLAAGVHPKIVQERLGHCSLHMVMRYSHVTMTMQREATEALRRALA